MRFGRAPGSRPLLGHFLQLQRRPLEFLESLPAHGDLVEIRLGPRRAFVACHPEVAHQVLTDFRGFDRTGPVYDKVRQAMGAGLATAPYQDHRRQRLVMQPAFRHEHLRGYVDVMRQEIDGAMAGWRDGQELDMVEAMFGLTTTVALKALFSARIRPDEAAELRAAFDVFLRGFYARAVLPAAGRLPTPGNRRYDRALARWHEQVERLIEDYRQAGADRGDLMSRLLAARDDEGHAMSPQELSDQVAVLLLAGGETTSSAVVWAMHVLAGHPDIRDALHAEADAVLGGATAGFEHLSRLDLTGRVVREALRLYPPAWLALRTATRDTTLAGHPLPAGSMVVISPYILHRLPDFHAAPGDFDPDRWRESRDAREGRPAHRGAYLPFGAGATKCLGEEFGEAEATVILASIAARWQLTPVGGPVAPSTRLVLVPKEYRVRLADRGGRPQSREPVPAGGRPTAG
ncbi:cytochrome P450 [Actinacidiphila acididurans]|uniref:Cytochrome P450 n=1 Tax=Actinacidiphila acididurans TaxID=2784346 RepID=A0ABS2TUB4_9ACTN|nr:cytochrome P450 [Actinacidiphila acididurans]MBM9506927.1 cytochrome P450 [Actinacidiphila acididurans]